MVTDKRRISETKARYANFRLTSVIATPVDQFDLIDFERVTCVVILPFTMTGDLVLVRLNRGLDIPGGHVQKHETTIAQVARRETLEEAAISLGELYVTGIIESDYFGSQPKELTYIIVVSCFVQEIYPFVANEEVFERLIIPPHDFLPEYKTTTKEMMQQMIIDAQMFLFNEGVGSGEW